MKAIFVSFNQAYYEMILNVMDRNNIRGFTYWNEVQGRGSKTGEPLEILHQMDQKTEAQGLRAFVWNIEKTI